MIFSGIEAYWQQRLPVWLAVDGAMMLFYVSLMVGFLWRPALVGVFLGLAWFTVGIGLTCQGRCLPALGSGLGRLLHGGMELALNTLSFMRVGAFALAHASLAGVVNSIALSSEDPLTLWIVMILGHSLTIAIEAFLVFIQTFRLLLFEFCLRFLQADGRLFRQLEHPLKVPHDTRRRAVE
jgi:V/A-type H+-transporting ATPase subunit I